MGTAQLHDLCDSLHPLYAQPRCPVCGQFASRLAGRVSAWTFRCMTWTGEGWEHLGEQENTPTQHDVTPVTVARLSDKCSTPPTHNDCLRDYRTLGQTGFLCECHCHPAPHPEEPQ